MSDELRTIQPRGGRAPAALAAWDAARDLFACARPHQWAKNLFVLAPVLFGGKLAEPVAVGRALLGAAVFCLLASSMYVANDVLDRAADRAHPQKRRRPVASGALPVPWALLWSGALLAAGIAAAALLGPGFLALSGGYVALVLGYSLVFKAVPILDVLILGAGFVMRLIGGALAVSVVPTHWLILCAFLLALFLGFAKRRQELLACGSSVLETRPVLGGYTVGFLDQTNAIVACAAVICYALYTVAPDTVARFGTEKLVYGNAFVVYGLLRYLLLIQNPKNGEDASRLLVRDRPLLAAVAVWAAYNAAVIYRDALASLCGFRG